MKQYNAIVKSIADVIYFYHKHLSIDYITLYVGFEMELGIIDVLFGGDFIKDSGIMALIVIAFIALIILMCGIEVFWDDVSDAYRQKEISHK